MNSFPTPDPLPVRRIALVTLDELRSLLGLVVGGQRSKNGGDLGQDGVILLLHRETLLHKARVVLTAHKTRAVHQRLVEGDVGAHTDDAVLLQRAPHAHNRLGARLAPHNQLGDHRVVERRNLKAGENARIHAHARPGGDLDVRHLARRGHETVVRVFGVDAALDCCAVDLDVFLAILQRTPARDAQLLLDDIHAGHKFGDRMLHLQARVHFQEIELVVFIHQELDRPGVDVLDGLGGLDGHLAHSFTQIIVNERRGRFLDQFLVTALDRTFALVQVDDVAVCVGDDLDFDMARPLDQFLQINVPVAESGLSLTTGRFQQFWHLIQAADFAHALTAAARRGLNQQRKADLWRDGEQIVVKHVAHIFGARHDRHARFAHRLAGGHLVAHRGNRRRLRPDERDIFGCAHFGELVALGQEAVAGVDRVCPRFARHFNDLICAQVRFARRCAAQQIGLIGHAHMQRLAVGLRIDGHGFDTLLFAGANDTDGDFAAVGNQDFSEHTGSLRNTHDGVRIAHCVKSTAEYSRAFSPGLRHVCSGASPGR